MKYLKVFVNFAEVTEALTDAEMGRLFRAMMEYASTGTKPDLRGNERYMWGAAKLSIDQQSDSYANKVNGAEKARQARSDIRVNQNDINAENLISTQVKNKNKNIKEIPSKEGTKKSVFQPPTVEEVKAYCAERKNDIDAQYFVDYYNANHWIKANGEPVRNWKQTIVTWEKNWINKVFRSVANDVPHRKNKALDYKQTPINENDFNRMVVNLDGKID